MDNLGYILSILVGVFKLGVTGNKRIRTEPIFKGNIFIKRILVYVFSLSVNIHNCTFNDDLCRWTNDINDEFDWTRGNSCTPSLGTGPCSDHGNHGKIAGLIFVHFFTALCKTTTSNEQI